MEIMTEPRTGQMTRLYHGWQDAPKRNLPIRALIEEAIAVCHAAHPGIATDMLILNPIHRPEIGDRYDRRAAAGDARFCRVYGVSYSTYVGPREVRVGPVD